VLRLFGQPPNFVLVREGWVSQNMLEMSTRHPRKVAVECFVAMNGSMIGSYSPLRLPRCVQFAHIA